MPRALLTTRPKGRIIQQIMLPREILKKIRRLEIKTSRLVEGSLAGSYISTFKGRGIEFTEVREYSEGDDVRAIDWNVTARMGQPFVKTFMEERDLTVILAVDLSRSMDFGTVAQSKKELAVDFCAAAALLAVKNSDRVGLVAFTDKVELFVPPRKGRRHVLRLLANLAAFSASGTGTEPASAATFLMNAVKQRATVFWVSDFVGVNGAGSLRAASRRHELVPVLLQDRREEEMPAVGLVELIDPETGARMTADTSSRGFAQAFSESVRRARAARELVFRELKSEPIELWTGGSPIMPLARYFHRKARMRRH